MFHVEEYWRSAAQGPLGNGAAARGQQGQAGRTSGSRGASSARGRLRRGRVLESVREVGPQVGRRPRGPPAVHGQVVDRWDPPLDHRVR